MLVTATRRSLAAVILVSMFMPRPLFLFAPDPTSTHVIGTPKSIQPVLPFPFTLPAPAGV